MASAQEAVVMNAQDKEIVEKMVEVAKNIGLKQNNGAAATQEQHSAIVAMMNNTAATVVFSTNQNWSGQVVVGEYPTIIALNTERNFTHGVENDLSKGAVVYRGINKVAVSCAWLLAWSAPKFPSPTNPNKVYVKCGLATDFQNIDWAQIQALLDASSNFSSFTEPIFTKTSCMAYIDPVSNFAAVGATFGLS